MFYFLCASFPEFAFTDGKLLLFLNSVYFLSLLMLFSRDYEFLSIIDYKNYIIQKKKLNLDYRKQWYPTTAFLKCVKTLF